MIATPIGGYLNSNTPTDGTVRYWCITGGDATSTVTIANANQLVSTNGEFSQLYVELSASPGGGTAYTFSLVVGGGVSSLAAVISGANVSGRDMTNKVRVTAGQTVCLQVQATTGVPGIRQIVGYVLYFKPDRQKETLLLGGGGGYKLFQADNQYNPVSGWDNWQTASERRQIIPCKGTLKNLYISGDVGPGGVTVQTITLQVNGLNTTLTTSLTGAATTNNDTTHSVAVKPGDYVRLRGTRTGVPVRILLIWGLTFVPENDGECIWMACIGTLPVTNATRYTCLQSNCELTATWRIRGTPLFRGCYIKNFFVDWGVATGAGQSVDLYVSRELQTGATTEEVTTLHVNLSNAQTGSDTLHSVWMSYDFSLAEGKYVASVTAAVPNGDTTRVLWSVVIHQNLKSNLRLKAKGKKPYIRTRLRRMS